MKNKPLQVCNVTIQPGEKVALALPTPELYTCAPMHIPIHVLHGKKEGPCLLVCSGIHGDETSGIAMIQRLLNFMESRKITGTLIAVPVLNVYGLISQQRNLPDRRDLERNFPGSETGSYAARYAHSFVVEIFSKATHCISLHTGEPHYQKAPQIVTNLKKQEALDFAKVFCPPFLIHSEAKYGFLSQMEEGAGIPTLNYHAGEAMRLDEQGIRSGLRGIIRIMEHFGMVSSATRPPSHSLLTIHEMEWIRSPGSGICHLFKRLGNRVKEGDEIAAISDPFGTAQKFLVRAPYDGVIIEQNVFPLTNEGESLVHLAKSES